MKAVTRGRPDFVLLFVTIILIGLGMVMIFSSSSAQAIIKHDHASYYVYKQLVFAGIGFFLMLLFMGIPYRHWKKIAPFLLLVSLLMLVLVLLVGNHVNGAKRWFMLAGFNLQPAEFTKLSLILYLSTLISKKGERVRSFKKGLIPILIVVGLLALLVMLQPDFGTVIILVFIAGAMIVVGGADLRQIFMLLLGMVPLLIYLAVSKSYRLERLNSFMNPFDNPTESGYQLIQSLYALGSGGLSGKGLGQSVQKLFYLPEAHTDFIFAVIGEELGFIGAFLVLIVFFIFIWRGFRAAFRCPDLFGVILGMGIVTMLFVQFLLNLGAVTGSLPITGVPLPFISYGGSSLILCMASTGILLSISRDKNRVPDTANDN